MRWVLTKWLQPTALLTAGAAVWRAIHRPSFHVLRCVKAAVPLQMGYAQLAHASARGTLLPGEPACLPDGCCVCTSPKAWALHQSSMWPVSCCLHWGPCRFKAPAPVGDERRVVRVWAQDADQKAELACVLWGSMGHSLACRVKADLAPGSSATGGSCAGPEQDEQWRAQHRRAARAVAHLMVDVYTEPPLGGLLPVLDTSSFTVASPTASSSLLAFSPGSTCLRGSCSVGGRLREPPPHRCGDRQSRRL